MFKIIILRQIEADRYQKLTFEILLLSPLENCGVWFLHVDEHLFFHSNASSPLLTCFFKANYFKDQYFSSLAVIPSIYLLIWAQNQMKINQKNQKNWANTSLNFDIFYLLRLREVKKRLKWLIRNKFPLLRTPLNLRF